jgi:hypothetical protein
VTHRLEGGHERPGGEKSNVLKNTNLIAHEKALEAASAAITLAMRVPAPLKSIADQVIRSASSVPANLAEGHGRCGRDRLHFCTSAPKKRSQVFDGQVPDIVGPLEKRPNIDGQGGHVERFEPVEQ